MVWTAGLGEIGVVVAGVVVAEAGTAEAAAFVVEAGATGAAVAVVAAVPEAAGWPAATGMASVAATIPRSISTVDSEIPRLSAICAGLAPRTLSWSTRAACERVTLSSSGISVAGVTAGGAALGA